ncbi:hypothetical protein GCM10023187_42580 [Nibrella viscosa]|uniref:NHL repeat-containing protein n=1 Tax=Nibrella viscosa TaxID=1084524 RepID=A0ABP8KRW0_9BACT
MKHLLWIGLWILTLGCRSRQTAGQPADAGLPAAYRIPYQLTAPDQRYTVPPALTEISGLAYYKNDQLLCVEDEKAVVYVYDTRRKQVIEEFGFGGFGDFEDVAWVTGNIYVLESDGTLFRFKPGSTEIGRTGTDLPANTEVEGLGYEPATNRLLLAPKDGKFGGEKRIYSFDLRTKTVYKVWVMAESRLDEAGIDGKAFKPSGLAVHPISGDWYLLSSTGKRLLVTNAKGELLTSVPLDPKQFRQPEGICFAPNGDLYIASEGDGKSGYILKFLYRQ